VFVVVFLSNWQYVCSSLLSGDHILRLYDSILATNISNSEHDDSWGSLGSPAVTSSPKPKPITYQLTTSLLSQVSVPIIMSGRTDSTSAEMSFPFFRALWKLMQWNHKNQSK
jgi:hypothetical protein